MDWPQVKQLALQAFPPAAIALGRAALKPRAAFSGPIWHCPLCGQDGRFLPDRGRGGRAAGGADPSSDTGCCGM